MKLASSPVARNSAGVRSWSWHGFAMLFCTLVVLVVSCSDNSPKTVEKKKTDDIGREWKPKATYNPGTRMLSVDAKLANGQDADRVVITEFNAEGEKIVSSETNDSHLGVQLDPNTKTVTCEMSKGGHGIVTSSKIP